MTKTWFERVTDTREGRAAFEKERLILEVTEIIERLLEESEMTRSDLAEVTQSSRANITQLLGGTRNMTLGTLAGLGYALEHRFTVRAEPMRNGKFLGIPVRLDSRRRPKTVVRLAGDVADVMPDPEMRLTG